MDSRKNVDAKLKEEQTTRGTLFCAGMIAGEGLVGILLAVFAAVSYTHLCCFCERRRLHRLRRLRGCLPHRCYHC